MNDTSSPIGDAEWLSEASTTRTSTSFPSRPPPAPYDDTVTVLQLKVRALEKYKINYELLCSQLAELNTQIGLQLQRHELDVSTLRQTISTLQSTNTSLESKLQEMEIQRASQIETNAHDREYSERVHNQLTTVAELLKTTEKRMEEDDRLHQLERNRLQKELQATHAQVAELESAKVQLDAQVRQMNDRLKSSEHSEQSTISKLKKKYRNEVQAFQRDLEGLQAELEEQRMACRQFKKQYRHIREERDMLVKQLNHLQDDGAHLTDVIESQRADVLRHEKKVNRARAAQQSAEAKLKSIESELVAVKESLIQKNRQLEALRVELRDHQIKVPSHDLLQAKHHEIETLHKEIAALKMEVGRYKNEMEERMTQHRYSKELEHMRQLMDLNNQRTVASSKEMQCLKQELHSVQTMLQQHHVKKRSSRRETNLHYGPDPSIPSRKEVEKDVLQAAIMDEVARVSQTREQHDIINAPWHE